MTVLHETLDISRPIDEVFDYVSDFTTTEEWDATAISAVKTTPGEVAVGTEFVVVCALPVGSIRIDYRVVELKKNKVFELHGRSRFFDICDRITFTRTGNKTHLDYRAEFTFKPAIKPLAGLSRPGMEKMGRESVAGLGVALADDFPLNDCSDSFSDKLILPGLSRFTRLGYTQGKKRFNPMSASVKNKHVVITGATAGLGCATAYDLARRGAQLTLVARDGVKAAAVADAIARQTGNSNIRCEVADLSLLGDVDRLISRLCRRGEAIDVLINNAGALFNPRGETAEGLEQSYALLLLSPYRLTEGLKPLLLKAERARVINIVSGGMYSQKLDVDALANTRDSDRSSYSGSEAYARQKRALMVLTEEWAQRWQEEGVVVNAMHPGWADTPGVQTALPQFRRITRRVLRSEEEGADTIIWLAVATEAGAVSGKLFLDRAIRTTHLMSKTQESACEREKLLQHLTHIEWPVS